MQQNWKDSRKTIWGTICNALGWFLIVTGLFGGLPTQVAFIVLAHRDPQGMIFENGRYITHVRYAYLFVVMFYFVLAGIILTIIGGVLKEKMPVRRDTKCENPPRYTE